MNDWHLIEDDPIPSGEMFIWARPKAEGGWGIGLAYWNISGGWSDAYGAPARNATHWKAIGDPPGNIGPAFETDRGKSA